MSLPVSECSLHNLMCYPVWKPRAVQGFQVWVLSKGLDPCKEPDTKADFGNKMNILVKLATRGSGNKIWAVPKGSCARNPLEFPVHHGLMFCGTKTIHQFGTTGKLTSQIMLQKLAKQGWDLLPVAFIKYNNNKNNNNNNNPKKQSRNY